MSRTLSTQSVGLPIRPRLDVANHRRGRIFGIGLTLGILAAVVVPAASSAHVDHGYAGSGCPDENHGHVCFWNEPNFEGYRWMWDTSPGTGNWFCIGPGNPTNCGPFWSARNKFGNRKVRAQWDASGEIRCLDAGESRDWYPNFAGDLFRLGTIGSVC
jgi:hypothetical protein